MTDTHGQYIEAQSGVKLNQAAPESGFNTPFNQLYMRPFYTETKSEYWFPVKETAGMIDASPTGTLNLVKSKDSLYISFCPNIPIRDSLTVSSDGATVLSEFLQLKPMQVYHDEGQKVKELELEALEHRPDSKFALFVRSINHIEK